MRRGCEDKVPKVDDVCVVFFFFFLSFFFLDRTNEDAVGRGCDINGRRYWRVLVQAEGDPGWDRKRWDGRVPSSCG